MAPDPIVIRKYENRRLYDTENSRYINLDDVARIVRGGREVLVVDARTGDDVTRFVLAQVILEESKRPDGLPLAILREIVRASDRVTREFLQWVITVALDQARRMQDVWREQIAQGVSAPWTRWSFGSDFPLWPASLDAPSRPQAVQPPAGTGDAEKRSELGTDESSRPASSRSDQESVSSELHDLRRRVSELEARVARRRRRKATRETGDGSAD